MREVFRYFRDEFNRPLITVCVLAQGDQTVSMGWAICSPTDNPCKATGRNIARGRAVKAMRMGKEKIDWQFCRSEAIETLRRCGLLSGKLQRINLVRRGVYGA